jgi:hypothetical protein
VSCPSSRISAAMSWAIARLDYGAWSGALKGFDEPP